jgi:hypothetical protein
LDFFEDHSKINTMRSKTLVGPRIQTRDTTFCLTENILRIFEANHCRREIIMSRGENGIIKLAQDHLQIKFKGNSAGRIAFASRSADA